MSMNRKKSFTFLLFPERVDALCGFFETAKVGKNYTVFEKETEDFANLLTKILANENKILFTLLR